MAEEHEIDRILRVRSEQIGSAAADLSQSVEAVAAIDVAMAKARLAFDMKAREPEVLGTGPGAHRPLRRSIFGRPVIRSSTQQPWFRLISGSEMGSVCWW